MADLSMGHESSSEEEEENERGKRRKREKRRKKYDTEVTLVGSELDAFTASFVSGGNGP